jgi:hypothetical protein
MKPPVIRRRFLVIVGMIGFFVPVFWGVLGLILFNAPEGLFSNVFWNMVYVSCPFWLILPEQYAFWLIAPLTATLYMSIYCIVRILYYTVVSTPSHFKEPRS